MTARRELPSQRRWRLRSSRLWLLSGILGAATVYSIVRAIHDTRQLRQAAHLVVVATAERVASRAAHRLDLFALQSFAPVLAPSLDGADSLPTLAALVRAQRDAERCRCREMLAASAFFRFDVATGVLDVAPVAGAAAVADSSRRALIEVGRREAGRMRVAGRSPVRMAADPSLGDRAVVTALLFDSSGAPTTVYGLVADARSVARALFEPEVYRATNEPSFELAHLDSLSLRVSDAAGRPLFGDLRPAGQHLVANVRSIGPLAALSIVVALTREQLMEPMLIPVPRDQLWHLGALLAATVIVIGIGIESSRREAQLERARSDFIAGISHDLRMPLAQILIASETLTMRRERDETQRLTLSSSILREARRLIALVENVLLFSRSGSVELRARLETVRVGDLFDDVVEAVALAVEDAGQTIDVRDGALLAVLGDRQLVRQALVNLVDNALKYGARGQRIHLDAVRPHPSTVRLIVEDEGPGIPGAERARVFEPYERLSRDQASERTGTGLGLSVVRQIVQACEGRVWLEDAPGGGTRAVIELRAAEAAEPALAGAAVS